MTGTSPSLELDGVTVDFPIYSGGSRSLKKTLVTIGTGGRIQRGGGRVSVEALKDISLRLGHGDRLGLVGHNGAGKTTLLRTMAGVYEPSAGRVRASGRIATIFDFTLGLDFDATGYENITLQGMLLGLSRKGISTLVDEIAAFTDLGGYLDMPIRAYSAGMLTRLAFAVATSTDPDILLMDEWIETGDADFFQRAEARLNTLIQRAGILVLASHNLALIRHYCTSAVWLEHGQVKAIGPVEEILEATGMSQAGAALAGRQDFTSGSADGKTAPSSAPKHGTVG
jgi:ABC-2 type transport system ATP-binding protein/lipopolysaccharide transport system ATP-binding protein